MTEIEKVLRAWRRQAVIWGILIGLLAASVITSTITLIDHPHQRTLAVVCPNGLKGRCFEVSP